MLIINTQAASAMLVLWQEKGYQDDICVIECKLDIYSAFCEC